MYTISERKFCFLLALLKSGSREHWDSDRVRPAWVGGSWKARKYYSREKNSSHSGASWSWSCPWLGRHQRGWQPSWCPGSHHDHSHHRPHPRHASTKPKSTLHWQIIIHHDFRLSCDIFDCVLRPENSIQVVNQNKFAKKMMHCKLFFSQLHCYFPKCAPFIFDWFEYINAYNFNQYLLASIGILH